jgi:hypothetical protein
MKYVKNVKNTGNLIYIQLNKMWIKHKNGIILNCAPTVNPDIDSAPRCFMLKYITWTFQMPLYSYLHINKNHVCQNTWYSYCMGISFHLEGWKWRHLMKWAVAGRNLILACSVVLKTFSFKMPGPLRLHVTTHSDYHENVKTNLSSAEVSWSLLYNLQKNL